MHGCFSYLLLFSFLFSFFITLLPIIIDLVFTLSYHVTLTNYFWYSDCFYPFCLLTHVFNIKKGLHMYCLTIVHHSRGSNVFLFSFFFFVWLNLYLLQKHVLRHGKLLTTNDFGNISFLWNYHKLLESINI